MPSILHLVPSDRLSCHGFKLIRFGMRDAVRVRSVNELESDFPLSQRRSCAHEHAIVGLS